MNVVKKWNLKNTFKNYKKVIKNIKKSWHFEPLPNDLVFLLSGSAMAEVAVNVKVSP